MWSTGINRNIVECKEDLDNIMEKLTAVLIETLWNVKRASKADPGQDAPSINRNIVECKVAKHEVFIVNS